MKKHALKVFALAILSISFGLVLSSCGSSSSSSTTTTSTVNVVDCNTVTPSTTVTVGSSNAFVPSTAPSIPVNGVVKWTTTSSLDHTVTSGTVSGSGSTAVATPDGKFNQTLNPGQTVCLQFTTAGTYSYYCNFHYMEGMIGSVTVQ